MITSPDNYFVEHISVAASAVLKKGFTCASKLIVTTPIQVVNLATMTFTGLPSPFDENELQLWNVEFW